MGLLLSFSSQDLPNSLTHNLSGLGVVSSFVLLVSIYSIKKNVLYDYYFPGSLVDDKQVKKEEGIFLPEQTLYYYIY